MIRRRQFSGLEPMNVTEISKLFFLTGQAMMNNLEFDSLFLKHTTVIYSHVM
jgi:hypothetical protein